jgi:hypothetical protein
MAWVPDVPSFHRAAGKDGKVRLYLLASNDIDIDGMLRACGLSVRGITHQKEAHFDGYYRIIKRWEEPIIRGVFPLGDEH